MSGRDAAGVVFGGTETPTNTATSSRDPPRLPKPPCHSVVGVLPQSHDTPGLWVQGESSHADLPIHSKSHATRPLWHMFFRGGRAVQTCMAKCSLACHEHFKSYATPCRSCDFGVKTATCNSPSARPKAELANCSKALLAAISELHRCALKIARLHISQRCAVLSRGLKKSWRGPEKVWGHVGGVISGGP